MNVEDVRAALTSRSRLLADGWSDDSLAREVDAGRLVRLHRGWYVSAAIWRDWFAEDRHLARVLAVHGSRRTDGAVFTGSSAAVAWELPLYRLAPARVHIAVASRDGRTTSSPDGVARHGYAVAADQRTEVNGIPCTSLSRTVLDVARTTPVSTGLAAADAALRRVAWRDERRVYDVDAAAAFRAELEEAAGRASGGRGIRRARFVIAFADGRAQLPGESVSRLLLAQLGFAVPELQVAVPAPNGGNYYVDFGMEDACAWGEFDGDAKYTLGGRDPQLTWREEKLREDWIRGTTGRPVARWASSHLSLAALGARLTAFRIPPPTRRPANPLSVRESIPWT